MDIPEYKKNRVLQYWMKEDFVAGYMSSPLPKGLLLQESLLHQLARIPTFLCSLKVKGTANQVTGAKGHVPCGPRDEFSTRSRT